jgi:hypothetical protein
MVDGDESLEIEEEVITERFLQYFDALENSKLVGKEMANHLGYNARTREGLVNSIRIQEGKDWCIQRPGMVNKLNFGDIAGVIM